MENSFYLFYLLGLIFCLSQIYLYFRREILKRLKANIKYYDSVFCVLLGLFALNILTLFSVFFNIVLVIIFFSWLDFLLYKNNDSHFLWWCHLNKGNYFYLGIIVFTFIGLFIQYKFYRFSSTLVCIELLSFGFFWKRMKQQKKIGGFVDRPTILYKIINWIGNVFHSIFYYIYQIGVIVFFLFLLFRIILWPILDPLDLDSCLDVNVCKEGNSFDDCGDGKPCTITKEYCLEHNYKWIEPIRSCDMNR